MSDTPQLPPPPKNWWQRLNSPATEPPSKAWYRNWFIVGLLMLGYVFWVRESVTPTILFFAAVVLSVAAGVMLRGWFGD